MVVMDSGDLLSEVGIFLKVTLAEEKLSDHAEGSRQKLIAWLAKRDMSPPPTQAYIDMNGGSFCHPKIHHQISNCYEEFDRSFDVNTKSQSNVTDGYMNNLYNNLSLMQEKDSYTNDDETKNYINIKHVSQNSVEDNPYINPSSPLANTPVVPIKPSLVIKNPSNSNSERNSVISTPDRISVSSSSLTSGSVRCEDSPDVLTTSASAIRYAASRTGLLGRREKFLFMEHIKQYWVALLHQTLFMFNSDKDNKPVAEMDISGYKARPVGILAKADYKFELVSPGKKTHQFCAEKQSDMEGWILVLNAATSPTDMIGEWGRQLPSLPAAQNTYDQPSTRRMTCPITYDQPDCAKRPVVEAEYELPDAVSRSVNQSPAHIALKQELMHFLSSQVKERRFTDKLVTVERQNGEQSTSRRQSASPREIRRLPLLPHQQLEVYDQPEPTVRPVKNSTEIYESLREELYHSIEDTEPQRPKEARQLPLLPHEQETYDQPEPTLRPVNNPDIQEEFYSVIDGIDSNKISQEAVYKNMEEPDLVNNSEDESNYYNLVPYPERETDQECIYDVITEQRHLLSPSPINNVTQKPISSPSIAQESITKVNEKRVSPLMNNMATIFSRPFTKPQLREVKPPVINRDY